MTEPSFELIRFFFPLFAFLCGSVPFSVIIGRVWAGIDVREHGSGNPGASNVFRVVSPAAGILAFLLDVGKGVLPVALAGLVTRGLSEDASVWYLLLNGLLAGMGHIFSPFLGFRGGKGVATFAGVFLVLFPNGMLVAAGVFLVCIALFRIFSLGSILGALALPVSYFIFTADPFKSANLPLLGICVLAVLLILARHTDNLKRLVRGQELSMFQPDAVDRVPSKSKLPPLSGGKTGPRK